MRAAVSVSVCAWPIHKIDHFSFLTKWSRCLYSDLASLISDCCASVLVTSALPFALPLRQRLIVTKRPAHLEPSS